MNNVATFSAHKDIVRQLRFGRKGGATTTKRKEGVISRKTKKEKKKERKKKKNIYLFVSVLNVCLLQLVGASFPLGLSIVNDCAIHLGNANSIHPSISHSCDVFYA